MDRVPHLFAAKVDSDLYAWLERLACWSPIIHLRQSDGLHSAHQPFTGRQNRDGVVKGQKVLAAIAASYGKPLPAGLPPRCEEIVLTLEIFSGTAATESSIIHDLRESVRYWRHFVPRDGASLLEMT